LLPGLHDEVRAGAVSADGARARDAAARSITAAAGERAAPMAAGDRALRPAGRAVVRLSALRRRPRLLARHLRRARLRTVHGRPGSEPPAALELLSRRDRRDAPARGRRRAGA